MRNIQRLPLVATLLALVFAGLVYLLAWSSIFSVSTVLISGAPTAESEKAILAIADIAPGQKLARVEPRSIAHRVKALTWIKSVDISRNWIGGDVDIAITPRKPTAYFTTSELTDATIDASGTVFTLPGFKGGDLPHVLAPTTRLGLAAISLFQGLPTDFKARVILLSAYNESHFAMQISGGGREVQVLWGKDEKSALKIQVITAITALEENKDIRRIDVSAPHAPIVR